MSRTFRLPDRISRSRPEIIIIRQIFIYYKQNYHCFKYFPDRGKKNSPAPYPANFPAHPSCQLTSLIQFFRPIQFSRTPFPPDPPSQLTPTSFPTQHSHHLRSIPTALQPLPSGFLSARSSRSSSQQSRRIRNSREPTSSSTLKSRSSQPWLMRTSLPPHSGQIFLPLS